MAINQNNQFNSIKVQSPKRNKFNLSYENYLTAQIGRLTPVACYEVVPGDTFSMRTSALIRLQALIAPLMHRMDVYFHNFYVPNRIVWDYWEDFITQDPENQSVSFPRLKILKSGDFTKQSNRYLLQNGSNFDYFGLPSFSQFYIDGAKRDLIFNELPFRAFQKIYNDYYRDENLQDELDFHKSRSGVTTINNTTSSTFDILKPLYRAWEKDYFTSALPDTQLGHEVSLPIRGLLEVQGFNFNKSALDIDNPLFYGAPAAASDDTYTEDMKVRVDDSGNVDPFVNEGGTVGMLKSNMGVNLGESVKITINELRKTVALQSWLERSFIGGTRYKESILAHFGVLVPDGRLQRAQYLGGGKQNIVISPVVQSSATDATTPQGNMAGYGVSTGTSNRWKAYFPEHGYVITIMSIMPKPVYQDTLDKMWSVDNVMDFYWPEFAHLGEEMIQKKEIFSPLDVEEAYPGESEEEFGYSPRYARYKFHHSEIHGEFKDTLGYWTLARKFENQPVLNEQFIRCNGKELNNPFAVTGGVADYPFICQLFHDVRAWRPMPVYATPRLLG